MTPEELAALSDADLLRLEGEHLDEVQAGNRFAYADWLLLSREASRRLREQALADAVHDALAATNGCHHPQFQPQQCRVVAAALWGQGVRKEPAS